MKEKKKKILDLDKEIFPERTEEEKQITGACKTLDKKTGEISVGIHKLIKKYKKTHSYTLLKLITCILASAETVISIGLKEAVKRKR